MLCDVDREMIDQHVNQKMKYATKNRSKLRRNAAKYAHGLGATRDEIVKVLSDLGLSATPSEIDEILSSS